MRLQLGEGLCALAGTVAQGLCHRDGGVVIQDRQRHPTKERERRDMAVAKRLGRLSWVSLDEERVECDSDIAR